MKAIKHSESCDCRECWRREPFHMMPNTACTNDHTKSNIPTPTIKLNLCNELNKKQLSSIDREEDPKACCMMPQINKTKETKSCIKLNSQNDQSAGYNLNGYNSRGDIIDGKMITFNNNEDYLRNISSIQRPEKMKNFPHDFINNEKWAKSDAYLKHQKLFYSNATELSDNFSEISPITSSEKKKKLAKLTVRNNDTIKSLNDEFYPRHHSTEKNCENIEKQLEQRLIAIRRYGSTFEHEHDSLFELNTSEIFENRLI